MGIQNDLKIRGSARASWPRSSANKVESNLFLPGWSCLELSFIMLLLKQKKFLGVPSVVRITTRRGKRSKTQFLVFLFRVISFIPFWKLFRLGNSA